MCKESCILPMPMYFSSNMKTSEGLIVSILCPLCPVDESNELFEYGQQGQTHLLSKWDR